MSKNLQPGVVQASHDDCASPLSYHASQVEPSSAAHGSTVIAAFQVGRVYDGGSCDIGWARTTDGRTWQHGLLPLKKPAPASGLRRSSTTIFTSGS